MHGGLHRRHGRHGYGGDRGDGGYRGVGFQVRKRGHRDIGSAGKDGRHRHAAGRHGCRRTDQFTAQAPCRRLELAARFTGWARAENRAEVLEPGAASERDEGERVQREEEHGEIDRPSPEAEHARIVPAAARAREVPGFIEVYPRRARV